MTHDALRTILPFAGLEIAGCAGPPQRHAQREGVLDDAGGEQTLADFCRPCSDRNLHELFGARVALERGLHPRPGHAGEGAAAKDDEEQEDNERFFHQ